MSPWRTILLRARPSLITLTAAILVALALSFGSGYEEGNLRADLQQHRSQTSALQANLDAKQQELAYIQTHIEQFRNLQKQGLMGVPARENWIEHLIGARKDLRLPDTLAYSMLPPTPLGSGSAEGNGGESGAAPESPEAPLAHDLEIALRDIHEDELLALFRHLQSSLTERFRVQSCHLYSPAPTGLSAECTLRFFTLPVTPKTPGSGDS